MYDYTVLVTFIHLLLQHFLSPTIAKKSFKIKMKKKQHH